ncbi:hypothetical protein I203_104400 [Kwoniella mangroviensis CBS 8507]|uniref:uncharacterized protein n=1 Tax=Kwoniella mangroviensis CBS 8507 TaxID=1296122 RepID=UPI00080D6538|nr:uncharacterized protein I203_00653 [Kwoniella mangroviensis CBS 8507]OCF70518.1 hypothetical protein I203_00653 [Kwoniella mangroviensis CBS 8507]
MPTRIPKFTRLTSVKAVQARIPIRAPAILASQPTSSKSLYPISQRNSFQPVQLRQIHTSLLIKFSNKELPPTSNPKNSNNGHHPPIEGATDLSHAHFISSASPSSDFNPSQTPTAGQDQTSSTTEDVNLNLSSTSSPSSPTNGQELEEWQGKLSPTSSHLFKLLIPLPTASASPRQTAFLLHPSQPLSHLSRLIIGSLPGKYVNSEITYLSVTGEAKDLDSHLRNAASEEQRERQEGGPYLDQRQSDGHKFQEVSWSQSTDLSDFIKQSCLNEKFKIVISPASSHSSNDNKSNNPVERKSKEEGQRQGDLVLEVIIPSFSSRTHYIRRRLLSLTKELDRMTKQKKDIDYKAHRGAQRLAVAALGGGVVYWAAVIRWTFFTDAGWDMMEPVTWATGFAALLGSAAFLIYHNREVSYSSLLDLSITARQRKLYDQAGLDIDKWTEMVSEAKTLRREITRIASDYDIEWKGELESENVSKTEKATKTIRDKREKASNDSPTSTATSTENEQSEEEEEKQEKQEKIDIDATIQEASDLAEQSEEKRSKEQSAQRKGKVVDTPEDKKDRGTNARKGGEGKSDSEIVGEKKAKQVIDG